MERLSLLLRYKAAQTQKLKLQQQLSDHQEITTPPHLAADADPTQHHALPPSEEEYQLDS